MRRKKRSDAYWAALLALALGSCVSPSGAKDPGSGLFSDVTVVERSRAETPAWVSLGSGRMHGGANGAYRFVAERSRLPDLAVGLKETQLLALQESAKALAEQGRAALGLAGDRDLVKEGASAELDRLLLDAAKDVHSRQAKVADIYFEKLSNDQPSLTLPAEFYKAFVLVQVPREAVPELVAQLAKRLVTSGDARMRRLGQALQKSPPRAPELSH